MEEKEEIIQVSPEPLNGMSGVAVKIGEHIPEDEEDIDEEYSKQYALGDKLFDKPLEEIPLRELLGKEFLDQMDNYFKEFCRQVRRNLKDERDEVIAITAYPGMGKSQLTALASCLIDKNYSFARNISFIPTSKDIKDLYLRLPMYSVLHIDEASRGLHKHKWQDKLQQTLNELYDTDREGHFLCSFLDMPRFNDFTEKFRHFRISWHIWIIERGLAIVYKKDLDKDIEDPWHTKESIKIKDKFWRNKKLFERDTAEIIRAEQKTPNYCFYFRFPKIPDDVWKIYQSLKKKSRVVKKEDDDELETASERIERERLEKMVTVKRYIKQGLTTDEIAIAMGKSASTVQKYRKKLKAWETMKGPISLEEENNCDTTQSRKEDISYSSKTEEPRFQRIQEGGEQRAESSTTE